MRHFSKRVQPSRLGASQRYFTGICWAYISFIVVWFCLRLTWFDREWWLALLNTVALDLFIPLPILLFLVVVWRQWRLLAGLAIPAVLFLALYGRLLLPQITLSLSGPDEQITVMSFNLLATNQQFGRISSYIHEVNPDIIGVQEIAPRHFGRIQQELSDYQYVEFRRGTERHTVGIFSRFPILSTESLANPVDRGLQAVLDVDGRPLAAIVSHLEPYGKSLFPFKDFVADVKLRYRHRLAEVKQLRLDSQNPDMPTVLMCDCNMTDTSQTYARLRSALVDSFPEAGWGFGFTYAPRLRGWSVPIKRIDYVWHSKGLRATNAVVGDGPGSDHKPVIATLEFTG